MELAEVDDGVGAPSRDENSEKFQRDVARYLANRVRNARLSLLMTQDAFAATVEIPRSTYARLEQGWRDVKVWELLKIAMASNRPISYFIEPPEEYRPEIVRTGWEPVVRPKVSLSALLASLEP